MKGKPLKVIEDNVGEHLSDLGVSMDYLNHTLKTYITEKVIDQLNNWSNLRIYVQSTLPSTNLTDNRLGYLLCLNLIGNWFIECKNKILNEM